MYRNICRKLLRSLSSPLFLTSSAITLTSYFVPLLLGNQSQPWGGRLQCLQTTRANKPQIIKFINEAKQQALILIYNRQSESVLLDQILKYQEIAQKLGIRKIVLVDQTDVRHLETFTRLVKQEVDEQDKKSSRQPIDLQNKIKILYVNPTFDTNKPFAISSQQLLPHQIAEIRSILQVNPKQQHLKESIEKFNCTTVIKNCYNSTCVDEYKQKIRQLIELELFRDKEDNFKFFVTNSKQEAAKILGSMGQSSKNQDIYVLRNDLLGKDRQVFSTFLENQGNKYPNENRFMMMIRPRVHIISRKSLSTDLYWYVSCLRMNPVPTFSINNTSNNLPIRVSNGQPANQLVIWSKGHYKQVKLLQKIKQKFEKNIELLILETNIPSEFFRFLYMPERYCIFKLAPQIPYPKMLIKPPTFTMDLRKWNKINKIQYKVEQNLNQGYKANDKEHNFMEQDNEDEEKWGRVIEKISKFIEKPINYDNVRHYADKQQEINAQKLKQMLSFLDPSKTTTNAHQKAKNSRWILRVCGVKNSCLYSAYQKYGIDINTPVYVLDGMVQNVNIDEGDYEVKDNSINLLS